MRIRTSIFWGKEKKAHKIVQKKKKREAGRSQSKFDSFGFWTYLLISLSGSKTSICESYMWCNGPKSCLDAKVCWWHSHSRAVYMAQCCQSIQLPPKPLPESLVYALQKNKTKKINKGSIIFYRSSPVALNRERCTSILKVEDVVSQSVMCQV